MPSWKKVIVSGSDAALNSILVTNGATITGSFNVTGSANINGQLSASSGHFATRAQIGELGTEQTSVKINGLTFNSNLKVSDLSNSNAAQTILHKHSTTVAPIVVGARSNSDTTSHGAVVNDMPTLSIYGAGWTSGTYSLNGQINIGTDDTGTISGTSSPGKIEFWTTPNGTIWPEIAMKIDSNKKLTVSGSVQAISFTGSLLGTASFATTSSFVTNLNQNVLITGSATIGATSAGANENTLTLGARDAASEGGQIGFNAPGGTYTSASFIDNWQNKARLLKGNNTTSTGVIAQWDIHTTQMQLAGYTGASSFPGTATANLAVDSGGNVITVSTTGGTVFPYIGNAVITGSLTTTGIIYAQPNGGMYFQGGDDAALYDINISNHMGIYGVQDSTVASIKLGSGGGIISGKSGNIGIGTINPTSASLQINGNVFAASFTGSLQGTASYATTSLSASYALTAATASNGSSVFTVGSNKVFSEYNSGGTANDALKISTTNLGATFGVQNTNASGFSGIEYIDNANTVKVFTGYNNSGTGEFRFNNVASNGFITFKIGSADKLTIANSGNVGIGTTSPNAKLDVNGNAIITGSLNVTQGITGSLQGTASYASQALSSSFATTAATASFLNGGTNGFIQNGNSFGTTATLGTNDNNSLQFETNNSTRMFISSSGNVGIGTTTPGAKLDITSTSGDQLRISYNSTYYWDIGREAADGRLSFTDSQNGEKLTILGSGNVGIGTTSPTAKLHVAAPGALSTDIALRVRNSADTADLLKLTGNGILTVPVVTATDSINIAQPAGAYYPQLSFSNNGGTLQGFIRGYNGKLGMSSVLVEAGYTLNVGFGFFDSNYAHLQVKAQDSLSTSNSFAVLNNALSAYFFKVQNNGNVGIGKSTANAILDVSGSTLISGSLGVRGNTAISSPFNTAISGSTLTVYGSGSAQPVFTVQGSQGELFSVTDSLSGSLFSVNDISGLPIMEVFSDNTTLMGSYQAPSLNTTVKTTTIAGNNVIYSVPTSSYNGAWFEYVATSASNARAGQIMSVCSSNTIKYTETTTTDIGTTAGLNFMVMITGSNFALTGSSTTAGWTIKTIVRSI